MRQREKAISAELKKVRARAFVLESQRNNIRKHVGVAGGKSG
jgi:hypothetical protein